MRKKLGVIGSAMALVAGGLIGSVNPSVQSTESITTVQPIQASDGVTTTPLSTEPKQSTPSNQREYGLGQELDDILQQLNSLGGRSSRPTSNGPQAKRFYRNVSNGNPSGVNRITRRRRTRRKHRRS